MRTSRQPQIQPTVVCTVQAQHSVCDSQPTVQADEEAVPTESIQIIIEAEPYAASMILQCLTLLSDLPAPK